MLAEDVRKAKYILFFIDTLTHKTTELAGSVDRWHFPHKRFKRTPTSMSEFNFPMMISRMPALHRALGKHLVDAEEEMAGEGRIH